MIGKALQKHTVNSFPKFFFVEISRLMLPELCIEVEMTLYLQD
jgi:hypothetical protein